MIRIPNKVYEFMTHMRTYQQKNNIKGECLTHSICLYDFLKSIGIGGEIKCYYVYANELVEGSNMYIHCVVKVGDNILDSSLEVNKYPNAIYYVKITDVIKNHNLGKKNVRFLLDNKIEFDKLIPSMIKRDSDYLKKISKYSNNKME